MLGVASVTDRWNTQLTCAKKRLELCLLFATKGAIQYRGLAGEACSTYLEKQTKVPLKHTHIHTHTHTHISLSTAAYTKPETVLFYALLLAVQTRNIQGQYIPNQRKLLFARSDWLFEL